MSLQERLAEYVRAGFAGIWLQSFEHEDALRELAELCQQESWQLQTWDIYRGLRASAAELVGSTNNLTTDPLGAVHSLRQQTTADGVSILALVNFHRFLGSAEILQALAHQVHLGKQSQKFLVILAPVVNLPVELEKLFVCLEHELPDREQLQGIAEGIATGDRELPDGVELDRVLDASAGLTRYEAEGAFSLAVCRHGRLEPSVIWELKTQALKKSGLLTLHRGSERFADLGGLESLKTFCLRALRHREGNRGPAKPRGVLLLGVPGTGKSAIAKSLGNETGRPTLTLDVGSLMGSLVGQSEQRTRQALQIVDAMQPAILFVDEIEKGLAGAANSGQTDSGVTSRILGTILSWLNDHESDVFVVCTANDISKLPPELTRAERFDAIFFLDLPTREQRAAIWQLYLHQFELEREQRLPEDDLWTGAEIRSCCRLAALLDMPVVHAAENIVPIARTASENVERLRLWADGRCLSADVPGLFRSASPGQPKSRRSIARPRPENN